MAQSNCVMPLDVAPRPVVVLVAGSLLIVITNRATKWRYVGTGEDLVSSLLGPAPAGMALPSDRNRYTPQLRIPQHPFVECADDHLTSPHETADLFRRSALSCHDGRLDAGLHYPIAAVGVKCDENHSDVERGRDLGIHEPSLLGANARLQASAPVTQVGGPGLGGLPVRLVSAPVTLMIRTPEPAVAERKESTIRQVRDGVAGARAGRTANQPRGPRRRRRVNDMTAERPENQRPRSSEASSYPHRGGTQ